MRKYVVITLLLAMLMAPATMDARKKKDKKLNKRVKSGYLQSLLLCTKVL